MKLFMTPTSTVFHQEFNIKSYDFESNEWIDSDMQDSIGPRSDMGTAAIESKMYLVGGTDGQQCLKSGCVIDFTTGESTEIAPMKSSRSNFCMETIDGTKGGK